MFYSNGGTMKCSAFRASKDNRVEKSSDSKMLDLKASPVKEPRAQTPSSGLNTLLCSTRSSTGAVHNKENSTSRDHSRTQDECFEDSGYLSLHNSRIDHSVKEDEDHTLDGSITESCSAAAHQEKALLSNTSPSKHQGKTKASHPASVVASTPVDCFRRKPAVLSPRQHSDPYLPILKFEQAVCEELAKSYKKNKKYDWSIVSEVAQKHHLDRVIGGHVGLEYVDVFTSLMSRNMKCILTNILSLLGDLDLISCRKVSKTWKRIICEDKAALSRCQQAEQVLRESTNSLRQQSHGLTRDTARVVLSCVQVLASSVTSSSASSSSSSSQSSRINRSSQKSSTPNSRFSEYRQAASSLKQHESLRSCRRCCSPAIHLSEAQRAVCTRPSCRFDFCTRCQEPFHSSSPCRTVNPPSLFSESKMTRIIPGSTRSKRSIRRL